MNPETRSKILDLIEKDWSRWNKGLKYETRYFGFREWLRAEYGIGYSGRHSDDFEYTVFDKKKYVTMLLKL